MAIADFEEINRPCCFGQRFPTAAASVTGIEFKVLPQNPLIPSVGEILVGFHGPKLPRKLPQALLNFSSTDVYPHSDFHESKKSLSPPHPHRLSLSVKKTTTGAKKWTAGTTSYIFYDWLIFRSHWWQFQELDVHFQFFENILAQLWRCGCGYVDVGVTLVTITEVQH